MSKWSSSKENEYYFKKFISDYLQDMKIMIPNSSWDSTIPSVSKEYEVVQLIKDIKDCVLKEKKESNNIKRFYGLDLFLSKTKILKSEDIITVLAVVNGTTAFEKNEKFYWIIECKNPSRFIFINTIISNLRTIEIDIGDYEFFEDKNSPYNLFDEIPELEENTMRPIYSVLFEQVRGNYKED